MLNHVEQPHYPSPDLVAATPPGRFRSLAIKVMLVSASISAVCGAEYVVSTKEGRDDAAGTNAAPFKTINRAAGIARAGDTVWIRGGVYRETVIPTTIKVPKAGEPIPRPITFQAQLGTGTVEINGTDVLKGPWTRYTGSAFGGTGGNVGGTLYSIELPWLANTEYHDYSHQDPKDGAQVFVDGEMVYEARQPVVTDLVRPLGQFVVKKEVYQSVKGSDMTIESDQLTQPNGTWNGALMSWNCRGWGQQTLKVKKSTGGPQGGTLTVESPAFFPQLNPYNYREELRYIREGDLFSLYRCKKSLTTAKQWYIDRATVPARLYLAMTTNPAQHTIEIKQRTFAFNLAIEKFYPYPDDEIPKFKKIGEDKSYIHIKNITIKAATIRTGQSSTGVVIDGVTASYVSHFTTCTNKDRFWNIAPMIDGANGRPFAGLGFVINGTGNSLTNCKLSFSAGHMVSVTGKNHVIANNIIHDVNYTNIGGAAISTAITYDNGPYLNKNITDIDIHHNTIYDTTHAGIMLNHSARCRVHDNLIYNTLLACRDTGAIYSHGTNADLAKSGGWNRIDHNIIIDPIGLRSVYDPGTSALPCAGIYLDVGSEHYLLDHNLIIGSRRREGSPNHSTLNCAIMNGGYNKDNPNGPIRTDLRLAVINNTLITDGISSITSTGQEYLLFQNNVFSEHIFTGDTRAKFSYFNNVKNMGLRADIIHRWYVLSNGGMEPRETVRYRINGVDVNRLLYAEDFNTMFVNAATCDYRLTTNAVAAGAGRSYYNPVYGEIATRNSDGRIAAGAFPYGSAWVTPGSSLPLPAGQPPTFGNGVTLPIRRNIPIPDTGLALWLDASQMPGLSNGNRVNTWVDQSGTGNNALRQSGSSASYPRFALNGFNGMPVVQFRSPNLNIGDSLTFTKRLTTIRTVFWVVRESSGTSDGHFLLGDSLTYDFHRGLGGNGTIWSSTYTNPLIKAGTTRLMGAVVNGTKTKIPVNEFKIISLTTTGNVQANQLCQDRIYHGSWQGDIAEVIIYTRALSASEERQVGRYLAAKYDLSAYATAN